MKKNWIVLISAVLFICVTLSSCHTTEPPCPAYALKQKDNTPYQEKMNFHQKNTASHQQ